jgi:DNA adenine methylase
MKGLRNPYPDGSKVDGQEAMAKRTSEIVKNPKTRWSGNFYLLKRFGSKTRLAKRLVELLPEHTTYVEVFGGTAVVLLAKPISPIEVYNDIDGELVNFFTVLRERPDELIARCFFQPYARADFFKYKSEPFPNDPVERAARYMFLANSSFRFHDICSNTFATHLAGETGRSSPAKRWTSKVGKLIAVAVRLRDVIIENRDFEEIINIYDRPEAVFFCDPPYTQGVFSWDFSEHLRLARCLKNLKGKFLLTIDDSPLSRQLYKDFNLVAVIETPNGMKITGSSQWATYRNLIITNYEVKVDSLRDGEPLVITDDSDGTEFEDEDFEDGNLEVEHNP